MGNNRFTTSPELATERLTLRQLLDNDKDEIFVLRSDDAVNKYLDRRRSESVEDARKFIQVINEQIQLGHSIYWAISESGRNKLIGTICLFNFSEDSKSAELGYELLPPFQGKGLMKEATLAVVDFAFQHLDLGTLTASVHHQNDNSIRLLKVLNFRERTAEENLLVFELHKDVEA